jgi:hypothetical protein
MCLEAATYYHVKSIEQPTLTRRHYSGALIAGVYTFSAPASHSMLHGQETQTLHDAAHRHFMTQTLHDAALSSTSSCCSPAHQGMRQ